MYFQPISGAVCLSLRPQAHSVIFPSREDHGAVVGKAASEDLVCVPLEHLEAASAVCIPHARGSIGARCQHEITTRVKRHLLRTWRLL